MGEIMLGFFARYTAASVVTSVAVSETHRMIDNYRAGQIPVVDVRPLEPIPLDANGNPVPLEERRVFGIPGASLETAEFALDGEGESQAQAQATAAGIMGERLVAEELARLAGIYPNMYVFNSVKLPGNTGDVDHVVIQGSTMLLVDSKNWKQSAAYHIHFSTFEADYISRNGESFEGGEIKLQAQTREWGRLFAPAGLNARAMLVVANRSSTVSESIGAPYWFTNLDGIETAFENTFSREPAPVLPPTLLSYMLSLVQSRMPAVEAQMASFVPAKPRVTTLTKWLVVWSCLNYAFFFLLLPIAVISTVPLLITAHKHRATLKKEGLPGRGLLTAVLVFTYLMTGFWGVFVADLVSKIFFL